MQDDPFFLAIVGALHYLADSGQWPYFLAFVFMVALGCYLAPRENNEVHFFD